MTYDLLAAFFIFGMIFCAFGFCVLLASLFFRRADDAPKPWDDDSTELPIRDHEDDDL